MLDKPCSLPGVVEDKIRRAPRWVLLALAVLLLFVGTACSGDDQPEAQPPAPTETAPEPAPETTTTTTTTTTTETTEQPWEDFDAGNFDRSTTIDNEWLPIIPGTQLVYKGSTLEEDKRVPHRVVITVTDLTKVISGVRTLVSWDRDYSGGALVEAELALFAQDNDGAVWHFGQYPEEYEDGKLADAPAWIAGIQNARPGIFMKAEPRLGEPSYAEGWAPAVNWTDRAQVYKAGQRTCVPVDCYEDVLVIEEFSEEEPGAFQLKYYARGVGNVRVGWRGDDPSKETLKLVELTQLSPAALAEARAEALKLEKRAYRVSEDVYAKTPRAEVE